MIETILAAYAAVMLAYMAAQMRRWHGEGPLKILLASLYLALALWAAWHYASWPRAWPMLAVLACCWLGDLMIIRNFVIGGVAFLAANVLSAVHLLTMVAAGDCALVPAAAVIAFIACYGLFLTAMLTGWLDLKATPAFSAYIATITLDGAIAIGMLAAGPAEISVTLTAWGYVLFMASDYVLALFSFRYKDSRPLRLLNTLTYFPGIMMLALALAH